MEKPILISGVQPSGKLHIGNYLGALKNFVDLQNSEKYQCYFFIADLHALTENPDAQDLSKNIYNLIADFLAAGLDPEKSVIFSQGKVSAHNELMWILNTITPMGELGRMTQFKDKAGMSKNFLKMREAINMTDTLFAEKLKPGLPLDTTEFRKELKHGVDLFHAAEAARESSNVGLFDYPVLMAADILLYDTKVVPVGNDQDQHLEITRTLARKFNSKFGKTFIEPQALHTKTPRVMSLADPEKKMSKSQSEGCLFIDDSSEEIKDKIKKAVTDSGSEIEYDRKNKPAISNLLEIYSALSGKTIPELEKEFFGKNYSFFKNDLADVVVEYFADFREKKAGLMTDKSKLSSVLAAGSLKAAKVANKKIIEVKKKIGLI